MPYRPPKDSIKRHKGVRKQGKRADKLIGFGARFRKRTVAPQTPVR